MIQILRGNHRRLYFELLSQCFTDYQLKLCVDQVRDCYGCKYADLCNDLKSASQYCDRLASKLPR